jgi:hypothetical protein
MFATCAAAFLSDWQQDWNLKGGSQHENSPAAAWSWTDRKVVEKI